MSPRRALPALERAVATAPPRSAVARKKGLFRWAGGKKHLVERVGPMIQRHRGRTGGRLISCFFGGGSIERACNGAAVAADKSPELLNLYDALQRFGPASVHTALLELDASTSRTPQAYQALGRLGMTRSPLLDAARFLWLSAMAFNGVWRVNSRGQMNMGVDRARLARGPEVLPPLEAAVEFAEQIKSTVFLDGWERALEQARAGDVVLADPPYGEFVGYTEWGFSARDQRLLARALREAVARGCGVIAFNAPGAESLYLDWGAEVEELTRSGAVSSAPTKRAPVAELLITAGLAVQPEERGTTP